MAALPPELLLSIFELLGFPWFARDVNRLLISKHWYLLARRAFFRDIVLQQAGLHGFLDKIIRGCREKLLEHCDGEGNNGSGNTIIGNTEEGFSTVQHPTLVGDLHRYTRTLALHLNGWSDDISAPLPFKWQDRTPESSLSNSFVRKRQRLNKELGLLLHIVRRLLPRLTGLQLKIEGEQQGSLLGRPYMLATTLMSLQHLSHLQELELDVTGRWTIHISGNRHLDSGNRRSNHICEAIAPLLTTLKRLKLRVPTLCPKLLASTSDSSVEHSSRASNSKDNTPINLEDLVINVANGLWWDDGRHCNGSISYHCNPTLNFLIPSSELYQDIIDAAQTLMGRSRNPRRAWLVGVVLNPFGDLFYYDILKDRNVLLENEDEELTAVKKRYRPECYRHGTDDLATSYLPPLLPISCFEYEEEEERWELVRQPVDNMTEGEGTEDTDSRAAANRSDVAGGVDENVDNVAPGRGFTGYLRGNDLVWLDCEDEDQREEEDSEQSQLEEIDEEEDDTFMQIEDGDEKSEDENAQHSNEHHTNFQRI